MENNLKQTDAIVMAMATKVSTDLAMYAPGNRKSMISLNGQPALSYLIKSLKRCEMVSRIIIVSDQPSVDGSMGADVIIEAKDGLAESVLAGIAASDAERCIIINGDMPLVSPESLTDLLANAPACDLVYPIVEKADMSAAFPDRPAFYVDTKEGSFTGSSCLLFDPQVALSKGALLTKLLAAKSDPKQLLGLLGPGLAIKFMFSKLALGEFEQHLSRALDMSCRVYITHFPEMLVSIDTPEDIKLMERKLGHSV